jgi:hypothetical protein
VYSTKHNIYLIVWRNDNDIVARLLSETGAGIGNRLLITRRGVAREGLRTAQSTKTGEFLIVWPDNRNLSTGGDILETLGFLETQKSERRD